MAFALVAVTVIVWKSNIIQKTTTAATIDGEKYTAAEISFHYENIYGNFLNNNYAMLSYGVLSLNPQLPLSTQVLTEGDVSMLELEKEETGKTWHDYFIDQTLEQMAVVQSVLKTAKDEGFTYPDSVQDRYDSTMDSLRSAAAASGVSVSQYLQANLGNTMTEKVYGEQLMRSLQYEAYATAREDGLTYSDAELEETYSADRNSYDLSLIHI